MDNSLKYNILERRLELGLSQRQLAERVGVSQPTICDYENGHLQPRLGVLRLLSETLHFKVSELLGEG
jgi:transcriptional regulator with XRE-family HTH domain